MQQVFSGDEGRPARTSLIVINFVHPPLLWLT
jgi:hypothetical protein